MKTSVVILNWNGVSWLEKFLPSVVKNTPNAKIIVADNGSTDDSKKYVNQNHSDVLFIAVSYTHLTLPTILRV